MEVGTVEGKNRVYDEDEFLPILSESEKVSQTLLPGVLMDVHGMVLESDFKSSQIKIADSLTEFYTDWSGIAVALKNFYESTITRVIYTELAIPFDLFVTNQRLIGISPGYDSTWLLKLWGNVDFWDNRGRLYQMQKKLLYDEAARYIVIHWDELERIFIDDDSFNLHPVNPDGLPGKRKCNIGLRRPYQVVQAQALLRTAERFGLKKRFTPQGKRRWEGLMNIFRYEDVEGLDTAYEKDGSPILESGERVLEQRECAPIVTLRDPYRAKGIIPYRYEFIRPYSGTLYLTNHRMLFIRPITLGDWHYRRFERKHRICFWVQWDKLKKKKNRFGIIYTLKLDKRNWLEILVPHDKKAETEALSRHHKLQEKKLALWPSVFDHPPKSDYFEQLERWL